MWARAWLGLALGGAATNIGRVGGQGLLELPIWFFKNVDVQYLPDRLLRRRFVVSLRVISPIVFSIEVFLKKYLQESDIGGCIMNFVQSPHLNCPKSIGWSKIFTDWCGWKVFVSVELPFLIGKKNIYIYIYIFGYKPEKSKSARRACDSPLNNQTN